MKTHLEKHVFFMNCCIILGGFWHHFGSDFGRQTKPTNPDRLIFWERPGGMRGGPGEDNGGVREPIPAENSGREPRRRQGTLEVGSSTPSPVGRRNASRIPPGQIVSLLFWCIWNCYIFSFFLCWLGRIVSLYLFVFVLVLLVCVLLFILFLGCLGRLGCVCCPDCYFCWRVMVLYCFDCLN